MDMPKTRRKTSAPPDPRRFWISRDGVIVSQKKLNAEVVRLEVRFPVPDPGERAFLQERLENLHFSERSRLARVGTEVLLKSVPVIRERNVYASCEAFVIDRRFPTHNCFARLLKPGVRVGRLFHAPEASKLTSNQIWEAVNENRIKLPDTVSIDRFGKVYFTPHRASYSLPPNIPEHELAALVSDDRPRSYLDKIQTCEPVENLAIPPRAGILTSCSMYLPEHYVVLQRNSDHFGVHTGAVLLDPVKTFGANVMLEIYNASDQTVVNPVVSLDIYSAPRPSRTEIDSLRAKRASLHRELGGLYRKLTDRPRESDKRVRPRANLALRGQSAWDTNESLVLRLTDNDNRLHALRDGFRGYQTLSQALSEIDGEADTLVMETFPNLSEHIEILARGKSLRLRRLIFRKASRTHRFFLPEIAQAQLQTYRELGLDVYWYNETLGDLFRHTYKRDRGFFIREEQIRAFQASTILAFYGSGEELSNAEKDNMEHLLTGLVEFFGHRAGVLTGGGGGIMAHANDVAERHRCLRGACFLELEAVEDVIQVDFFNTFQETARHNRQKWFELADFCIFNVGGVGTLEEIGIELCNLKLGIRPRAPMVFFSDRHWESLRGQVEQMVETGRVSKWILDYLLFTGDPEEVVRFYREKLQVL